MLPSTSTRSTRPAAVRIVTVATGAGTGMSRSMPRSLLADNANLALQRTLKERDEELGAARETHRRLMAEINRA